MSATPRPWKASDENGKACIRAQGGLFIADFGPIGLNHAEDDRDYVVRAVNNFDALLDAVKELAKKSEGWAQDLHIRAMHGGSLWACELCHDYLLRYTDVARAAIENAEKSS